MFLVIISSWHIYVCLRHDMYEGSGSMTRPSFSLNTNSSVTVTACVYSESYSRYNRMTEFADGVSSSLIQLKQQHYCIHLGGCYAQFLFWFCFAVTLWVCLVLNVTSRISNVIWEALSDELLAVKLRTLNAHVCTTKWRLTEERCLYKRMTAVFQLFICEYSLHLVKISSWQKLLFLSPLFPVTITNSTTTVQESYLHLSSELIHGHLQPVYM